MARRRYSLINKAASASAETNDLSSAVTWANIPIANVPTGTSGVTVALGDHAHAGVYEPVDTTIVRDDDAGYNNTDWDTAFGWGDHASTYVPLAGGTLTGSLYFTETGAASGDTATLMQVWSKNDVPNTLWMTDDVGTDLQITSRSAILGKTANYTMVIADQGQTVRFTGATAAQTFTIPANSSVAYPTGTLIGIENDGSVAISLAITTDTLTWSKDNTTGTRTLAAGASAVIHKVTTTAWKVSGSALVT